MVGRCRGFTYLIVLLATAILSAGVGLSIEAWHTNLRREKETELLHIGIQFQRAILLYVESSPNGLRRYPRDLKDLLKDERYPVTRRYLRKLYRDPITGSAEWGIMKAPDGGVMGVYSLAREAPLRTLAAGATYSDWKFAYQLPVAAPARPAAAAKPVAPAAR